MRQLFLCSVFLVFGLFAANKVDQDALRDHLLGNLVMGRLEMVHFSQKRIDKDLSKEAFKQFLDRLDHGKQFLLQSDVKSLEKYQENFRDILSSGEFGIVKDSSKIMKERIKDVRNIVEAVFKDGFNFQLKETLETEVKKREYMKTPAEMKELWRKTIKFNVLNQYLMKIQEQEDRLKKEKEKAAKKEVAKVEGKKVTDKSQNKKDKKGKKGKKEEVKKVLTLKELEKEAIEETHKNYTRIFERLLKEDHDDELDRFFNAVSGVFDPHTNYLPPQKKEDFDIEMKGSLEGIGAILKEDGIYIKVVKIVPGSASWKVKKLGPEDTIIKVAQGAGPAVDIVNMRVTDAVKLIRGPKGTEVRLTVKKPSGEVIIVPIIRDTVQLEESYAKAAIIQSHDKGPRIGYIYLPRFYRDFEAQAQGQEGRNCTDDVRDLVKQLNKQKVDGLILDLRHNGGGALEDARLMAGLFLPFGPVVQVKQSGKPPEVLYDSDQETLYDGNMVVMVNRFSASASEIVAAALQDYERAVVVGGDHTHGKGTVQILLNLDQGLGRIANSFLPLGALKITIQKFYRVTGGSTQYKGVTPDITFPDVFESLETGERYLDYSLKWDEVPPLKFQKWTKSKLYIPELKEKSEKRVKEGTKFQHITKNLEILNKRKNETVVSLNFDEALAEQKRIKEDSDKFKTDSVNKKIVVYKDDKGKFNLMPVPPDEKDERKDENGNPLEEEDWTVELRKDPVVEETLNIFSDWKDVSKNDVKDTKEVKDAK